MIAHFEQSLLEREIKALLDYYNVDLSGLAVFIDEGFEWLASQADKYKMAYIVNPLFILDIRHDKIRNHSKYYYEESDFIIDALDEKEFQQFDYRIEFLNKLGRQFMILGPHKKQEDFTMKDALRFDRIIDSCFDNSWYIRIPEENLILAEGKET